MRCELLDHVDVPNVAQFHRQLVRPATSSAGPWATRPSPAPVDQSALVDVENAGWQSLNKVGGRGLDAKKRKGLAQLNTIVHNTWMHFFFFSAALFIRQRNGVGELSRRNKKSKQVIAGGGELQNDKRIQHAT